MQRVRTTHGDRRPASTRWGGPAGWVLSAWVLTAWVLAACLVVGLLLDAGTGTALAAPPAPANPSDGDIAAGKAQVTASAGDVGRLAGKLADLDDQRLKQQAQTEIEQELANKAQVDLDNARAAAAQAQLAADQTAQEATAAGAVVRDTRHKLDDFAAASYEQGSMAGSMVALLDATDPADLLARKELLDAVSGSQLNALDLMRRAVVEKTNKDSSARKASEVAQATQAEAGQAKITADAAYTSAKQAAGALVARAAALDAQQQQLEQQLAAAQARVAGLQSQRQRYLDWQSARQREEAEAATAAAARAGRSGGVGGGGGGGRGGGGGPAAMAARGGGGRGMSAVIARAVAEVGVPYAWGGGNGRGPTRGIHDGGVADAYGDYAKVGFDCSGLMVYAFAGVGVSLPHYAGYQATSGRRVPVSAMQPGDMLFYADGGLIHHVTLYIGGGMMVEAPYSGASVRVVPVRYGGLVSQATRML
jgi:cell wall-associated NlpC family hydrolase